MVSPARAWVLVHAYPYQGEWYLFGKDAVLLTESPAEATVIVLRYMEGGQLGWFTFLCDEEATAGEAFPVDPGTGVMWAQNGKYRGAAIGKMAHAARQAFEAFKRGELSGREVYHVA